MSSEDDAAEENHSGAGDGVINVDGGFTQQEQLDEMEAVVEIMREHFGEDVATIEGEP